jgi:hypothetical protein
MSTFSKHTSRIGLTPGELAKLRAVCMELGYVHSRGRAMGLGSPHALVMRVLLVLEGGEGEMRQKQMRRLLGKR